MQKPLKVPKKVEIQQKKFRKAGKLRFICKLYAEFMLLRLTRAKEAKS